MSLLCFGVCSFVEEHLGCFCLFAQLAGVFANVGCLLLLCLDVFVFVWLFLECLWMSLFF